VLIAFAIPLNRKLDMATFRENMSGNLLPFNSSERHEQITLSHAQLSALDNIETEIHKVQSPVQSLEHKLHPFVTYLVMPLFALTNAGVAIHAGGIGDIFGGLSGIIELSLVLGKVIGIFLFTWLCVKIGLGELPARIKWVHIIGVGLLGGMGFTMSLFIANLAFASPLLLDPAKIGILTGSLLAGILGYILLNLTLDKSPIKENARN
jgi:NhaA family Na+:H+ antiporter